MESDSPSMTSLDGDTLDPHLSWRSMQRVNSGTMPVGAQHEIDPHRDPPSHDIVPATTGQDVPAGGQVVPAGGQDVPAGGQDVPAGGQDVPAGDPAGGKKQKPSPIKLKAPAAAQPSPIKLKAPAAARPSPIKASTRKKKSIKKRGQQQPDDSEADPPVSDEVRGDLAWREAVVELVQEKEEKPEKEKRGRVKKVARAEEEEKDEGEEEEEEEEGEEEEEEEESTRLSSPPSPKQGGLASAPASASAPTAPPSPKQGGLASAPASDSAPTAPPSPKQGGSASAPGSSVPAKVPPGSGSHRASSRLDEQRNLQKALQESLGFDEDFHLELALAASLQKEEIESDELEAKFPLTRCGKDTSLLDSMRDNFTHLSGLAQLCVTLESEDGTGCMSTLLRLPVDPLDGGPEERSRPHYETMIRMIFDIKAVPDPTKAEPFVGFAEPLWVCNIPPFGDCMVIAAQLAVDVHTDGPTNAKWIRHPHYKDTMKNDEAVNKSCRAAVAAYVRSVGANSEHAEHASLAHALNVPVGNQAGFESKANVFRSRSVCQDLAAALAVKSGTAIQELRHADGNFNFVQMSGWRTDSDQLVGLVSASTGLRFNPDGTHPPPWHSSDALASYVFSLHDPDHPKPESRISHAETTARATRYAHVWNAALNGSSVDGGQPMTAYPVAYTHEPRFFWTGAVISRPRLNTDAAKGTLRAIRTGQVLSFKGPQTASTHPTGALCFVLGTGIKLSTSIADEAIKEAKISPALTADLGEFTNNQVLAPLPFVVTLRLDFNAENLSDSALRLHLANWKLPDPKLKEKRLKFMNSTNIVNDGDLSPDYQLVEVPLEEDSEYRIEREFLSLVDGAPKLKRTTHACRAPYVFSDALIDYVSNLLCDNGLLHHLSIGFDILPTQNFDDHFAQFVAMMRRDAINSDAISPANIKKIVQVRQAVVAQSTPFPWTEMVRSELTRMDLEADQSESAGPPSARLRPRPSGSVEMSRFPVSKQGRLPSPDDPNSKLPAEGISVPTDQVAHVLVQLGSGQSKVPVRLLTAAGVQSCRALMVQWFGKLEKNNSKGEPRFKPIARTEGVLSGLLTGLVGEKQDPTHIFHKCLADYHQYPNAEPLVACRNISTLRRVMETYFYQFDPMVLALLHLLPAFLNSKPDITQWVTSRLRDPSQQWRHLPELESYKETQRLPASIFEVDPDARRFDPQSDENQPEPRVKRTSKAPTYFTPSDPAPSSKKPAKSVNLEESKAASPHEDTSSPKTDKRPSKALAAVSSKVTAAAGSKRKSSQEDIDAEFVDDDAAVETNVRTAPTKGKSPPPAATSPAAAAADRNSKRRKFSPTHGKHSLSIDVDGHDDDRSAGTPQRNPRSSPRHLPSESVLPLPSTAVESSQVNQATPLQSSPKHLESLGPPSRPRGGKSRRDMFEGDAGEELDPKFKRMLDDAVEARIAAVDKRNEAQQVLKLQQELQETQQELAKLRSSAAAAAAAPTSSTADASTHSSTALVPSSAAAAFNLPTMPSSAAAAAFNLPTMPSSAAAAFNLPPLPSSAAAAAFNLPTVPSSAAAALPTMPFSSSTTNRFTAGPFSFPTPLSSFAPSPPAWLQLSFMHDGKAREAETIEALDENYAKYCAVQAEVENNKVAAEKLAAAQAYMQQSVKVRRQANAAAAAREQQFAIQEQQIQLMHMQMMQQQYDRENMLIHFQIARGGMPGGQGGLSLPGPQLPALSQ